MTFPLRSTVALSLFAFTLSQTAVAAPFPHKQPKRTQQATGDPQTGPLPPQIARAHTVFLINDGADHNFPETAEHAYGAVYQAMQTWGRMKLVSSPAEADVLLKLRDIAPVTDFVGGDDTLPATAVSSPAFRATFLDPHTNTPLWTVTSPVDVGYKRRERERWFAHDVDNLILRLKVTAGETLTPEQTASLTTAPPRSHALYYLAAGTIAVGLGTGLVLHHVYDSNVAAQNAAACKQNSVFCAVAH